MSSGASADRHERRSAAPAAYEAYYGLAEPPFSLAPGVRFAFRSRSYAGALDQVRRAIGRREGLVVVTGEVGTGKSMLCRALLQESDRRTCVSLVLDPCVGADEILAEMLADFGVLSIEDPAWRRLPIPRSQLMAMLQRFLASLVPIGGLAVLVIDEAQHLHPAVLEQIRLWSNVEADGAKLLQIVLAGQPELDELIARPDMRQLKQRVSRRIELTRLDRDEVEAYLEHRLTVAREGGREAPDPGQVRGFAPSGFWRVGFSPGAVRTIAALSRGIPRVVNLLADRALEVGCERKVRRIDAATVRAAARRLDLLAPAVSRLALRAGAAAAVVAFAVTATWILQGQQEPVGAVAAAELAAEQAARPAPAETVAARTLPVQDSVTIAVASFRSAARAEEVAAGLVQGGFPAFVRADAGGPWYQVIVGPYVSPAEALGVQQALAAHGVAGSEVRLERIPSSEIASGAGGP